MRRWPKWAQNIALLGGSTVLSFILLEIVVRVFVGFDQTVADPRAGHRPGDWDNAWVFYEYDPLLGWKNKPRAEGFFSIPDSRTHVRINSKGLRDAEHSYEKIGKQRILVLGDSFTWGFGVEQADRYTQQLEAMMGPGVEIINAGVTGYGTDQELLYFTQEGIRYHPDVVVLQFLPTEDIINNNHAVQYSYPKPRYVVKNGHIELTNTPVPRRDVEWQERPDRQITTEAELTQSRWERGKDLIKAHFVAPTLIVRGFRRVLIPMREQDLDLVTRMLLLELRRQVTATGARFVVIMVPQQSQYRFLDRSWAGWRAFVQYNDFLYCDLRQFFRNQSKSPEKLHLSIDGHWNAQGHKMAAQAVRDLLSRNGLFISVETKTSAGKSL